MITPEEFRTGQFSLPSTEADDLAPCCFTCVYLSYKEFSANAGDGLFYYYCSYYLPERLNQTEAVCLQDPGAAP
ncbi:MAG: hypothetical protein AB1491_03840 [Thermodesulfobacteriota bacterium]